MKDIESCLGEEISLIEIVQGKKLNVFFELIKSRGMTHAYFSDFFSRNIDFTAIFKHTNQRNTTRARKSRQVLQYERYFFHDQTPNVSVNFYRKVLFFPF